MNKALCIARNKYGNGNDLNCCLNDANSLNQLLINNNFTTTLLLDNDCTKQMVTIQILNLINNAKDGDILFITYSGHGSQINDTNGDEISGLDDVWCLSLDEKQWLSDDELNNLVCNLNKNAHLVIISDSCHSGTMDRDVNKAYRHLYNPNFKKIKKIKKRVGTLLSNIALIAACKDTETAAEGDIDENNKCYGVLTSNLIKILNTNKDVTFSKLKNELAKCLPSSKYKQHPIITMPFDWKNKIILTFENGIEIVEKKLTIWEKVKKWFKF